MKTDIHRGRVINITAVVQFFCKLQRRPTQQGNAHSLGSMSLAPKTHGVCPHSLPLFRELQPKLEVAIATVRRAGAGQARSGIDTQGCGAGCKKRKPSAGRGRWPADVQRV